MGYGAVGWDAGGGWDAGRGGTGCGEEVGGDVGKRCRVGGRVCEPIVNRVWATE